MDSVVDVHFREEVLQLRACNGLELCATLSEADYDVNALLPVDLLQIQLGLWVHEELTSLTLLGATIMLVVGGLARADVALHSMAVLVAHGASAALWVHGGDDVPTVLGQWMHDDEYDFPGLQEFIVQVSVLCVCHAELRPCAISRASSLRLPFPPNFDSPCAHPQFQAGAAAARALEIPSQVSEVAATRLLRSGVCLPRERGMPEPTVGDGEGSADLSREGILTHPCVCLAIPRLVVSPHQSGSRSEPPSWSTWPDWC